MSDSRKQTKLRKKMGWKRIQGSGNISSGVYFIRIESGNTVET